MPNHNQKVVPRIQLIATVVKNRDRNDLMIRKIISNKEVIQAIVLEILRNGTFEFKGEVIFINKNQAVARLKEAGLIP